MVQYQTRDGDRLDQICLAYYGQSERFVEAVMSFNPRLTAHGVILPSGLIIDLPEFPELTENTQTIRLWD